MATEDSLFINETDPTLDNSLDRSQQSPLDILNTIDSWIDGSLCTQYPLSNEVNLDASFGGIYQETNFFDNCGSADLPLPPFQSYSPQEHIYNRQYGQLPFVKNDFPFTTVSDQSFSGLSIGVDPAKTTNQEHDSSAGKPSDNSRSGYRTVKYRKHDDTNLRGLGSDTLQRAHCHAQSKRNSTAESKHSEDKIDPGQDLECKFKELNTLRKMLDTFVFMLKNDLLILKCRCLDYSSCQCERIREYLQNTIVRHSARAAAVHKLIESCRW
jgi:hypothetical protein